MSQTSKYDTTWMKLIEGSSVGAENVEADLVETEILCQEFIESILKARPLERLPELAQALLTLADAVEKQGRDGRDLRQLASLLR